MWHLIRVLLIGFVAATVSAGRIQKRVVNGDVVDFGQLPYMVSLRVSGSSSHTCGGSLITPEHVITAAHCVVLSDTEIPAEPSARFVVSGHVNNWEGGRVSQIQEVRNHPEYNISQIWRNDISILKLATPIPFNAIERPIAIASSDVGVQECLVSGWGRTHTPVSHLPSQLQMKKIMTLSNPDCTAVWGAGIHDSTLCAGASRGTGICGGDSGGPLVCNGELAGIVSWANPCANGFPDAYARVFYFRDWIFEQTADLSPLGQAYMAEALRSN